MTIDLKTHNELREKAQEAYLQVPIQDIYYNSRQEMEFTVVKSKPSNDPNEPPEQEIKKVYLDPMTSAVIVNALVPKSGVIFRGGHGGGKTTLAKKVAHMLTGIPEKDITSAMIRGNDDQNVNTLLATLDFGKLMKEGEQHVVWRNFVKCYVKIIDELNRFSPSAQNGLFEIMNEGRTEYSDEEFMIDDFMAFATENPNDPGTYPLSKPFVDRFGFSVQAPQLASAQDQYMLAARLDDKLHGIRVTPVMTLEELKKARKIISEDIKMSSDALLFTIYLTQALATCERGDYKDKSHNDIPVGERCKGCGFDTETALCKMTDTGISGRAFLDFQRWGKGYSFLLNAFPDSSKPEVQLETIETIAPHLIDHRTGCSELLIAKDPYHGQRRKYLKDIVEKAKSGYLTQKEVLEEVGPIMRGELNPDKSKIMKVKKDLVIVHHFQPMLAEAQKTEFRKIYDEIANASKITAQQIKKLGRRIAFEAELRRPAQNYLISKAKAKYERAEHL